MTVCSSCGKESPAAHDPCLTCGPGNEVRAPLRPEPAPIPLTRVAGAAAGPEKSCPGCNRPVPAGFAFCGSCGARIEASSARGGTMFLHGSAAASVRPRARMVLVLPDGSEGGSFVLEGEETVAGCAAGAVRFPDDPYVSPRHCRFFYRGEILHVEDLGSLNGVYRRVRGDVELLPGDQLRLGRQLLRIEPMIGGGGRSRPEGTRIWGSPDPGYQARLLQILQGGSIGEVFPLRAGDNLVGREQGDVTFPTDRFVSGRHAVVSVGVDSFRVRDLGSSNGTFVRIGGPAAVEHGDFLLLGNQLLRIDLR